MGSSWFVVSAVAEGFIMKMTVRWTALALFLFCGVASVKAETPCEATDCDTLSSGTGCTPNWWFSADALFLHRTQNYSQTLVIDENNAQAAVLTGNNLDFGTAAGPRFAMGRQWDSGITTELVYFGMHDWSSTAQALGNNNLSLPGDLGLATFDFFAADRMDVSYGSRLQNLEANLWAPLGGVEWLAGFRHFSVIEDFKIASFDADTYLSDYQIQTNNQLYGGQVGVRKRWTMDWLGFAPEAKFGLLGNANNQHSLIRDLENSKVLRDETVSSSILSSLTELRLVGDASVTKNFKVTFGYNLLWLTGVAQAPYQFDSSYTSSSSQFVDDNHSIFYHGANVGLTWVR
jgi:hypothetical protein